MEGIENLTNVLEKASEENYYQYKLYYKTGKIIPRPTEIKNIYNTYLSKVLNLKDKKDIRETS